MSLSHAGSSKKAFRQLPRDLFAALRKAPRRLIGDIKEPLIFVLYARIKSRNVMSLFAHRNFSLCFKEQRYILINNLLDI